MPPSGALTAADALVQALDVPECILHRCLLSLSVVERAELRQAEGEAGANACQVTDEGEALVVQGGDRAATHTAVGLDATCVPLPRPPPAACRRRTTAPPRAASSPLHPTPHTHCPQSPQVPGVP